MLAGHADPAPLGMLLRGTEYLGLHGGRRAYTERLVSRLEAEVRTPARLWVLTSLRMALGQEQEGLAAFARLVRIHPGHAVTQARLTELVRHVAESGRVVEMDSVRMSLECATSGAAAGAECAASCAGLPRIRSDPWPSAGSESAGMSDCESRIRELMVDWFRFGARRLVRYAPPSATPAATP